MSYRRSGRVAAALLGVGLLCLPVAQAVVAAAPQPTTKVSATAAAKQAAPAFTRTLKKGCTGSDVKALQQRLNALGYNAGAADGIFGSGTEKAVKAFQQAAKLTADGIVGKLTFAALYGTSVTTAPTTTPPPSAGSSTAYGSLNNQITLKSGSKGADVRDLQLALKQKGFYSGAINSTYDVATTDAVKRFQRSVGIAADGIAGEYTLSPLYTLLNPPNTSGIVPWPESLEGKVNLPIEKLTWANADKAGAFPRGSNAVVVDVQSGYTFAVRRTGGTNHADVEPVSALDTATFTLAAGHYSWARRPIWVIVNGRRLAASMNCMPHGYDSIAANDMRGQFCIHFVDSRTHGSNLVDPEHQKAIEAAYQAGRTPVVLPADDWAAQLVDDGGEHQQYPPG